MDKELQKMLRSRDYETRVEAMKRLKTSGDSDSVNILHHIAEGRRRGRILGNYDAYDQIAALEYLLELGSVDYVREQLEWGTGTNSFGPLGDFGSGHLTPANTSYLYFSRAGGNLGDILNKHVVEEEKDGDLYHSYKPDDCRICVRLGKIQERLGIIPNSDKTAI